MSIASEITRLYGVRSDIFTSLTAKGVSVPASAVLDDVPDMVDSISAGGGAYTLDYTNPNQYCTFKADNPNCSRSGATITPDYTLTNNYVLDNLTLNGSNIQGSSFTMPATDSTVGMVVHQIVPIKLRIEFDSWDPIRLYNLRYNGNEPTLLGGIYHNGNDNIDTELSSSDLIGICDQYSPFIIYPNGSGSYIELTTNITTFDTSNDYFTWTHNWMWSSTNFTATVRIGNTVIATVTYTYPGDGSQMDVRIPPVQVDTFTQCYNCSENTLSETTHTCSNCGTQFSECPECGAYAVYEQPCGWGHDEYDEFGEPYYVEDYGNACGACGWHEWEDPQGDDEGGDEPEDPGITEGELG